MKIIEHHDIVSAGDFPQSPAWQQAWKQVQTAILSTDWPHGSGAFTIRPESGKKAGMGNGVKPIKVPCLASLEASGWQTEDLPDVEKGVLTTGDLDALSVTKDGTIAFEWETGNISSSHRAINKLLLTLLRGSIVGGFLVVPSDKLKSYLTDRIGNIGELRPYFAVWKAAPVKRGCLRVVVVEHDATSATVPRIPKGTDGRALR